MYLSVLVLLFPLPCVYDCVIAPLCDDAKASSIRALQPEH